MSIASTLDLTGPRIRKRARSSTLIMGAIIVTVLLLMAAFAPVLATHDPTAQDLSASLQAPGASHWMGTDQLGRDVWSRVVYSSRTDLRVGMLAVIIPALIGTAIGLVAGYFGSGWKLMSDLAIDINLSFPFYVIVLALVALLGRGEGAIYLTFALVAWVNYAAVVSAVTSSYVRQGWVEAARGAGLSHGRIICTHIVPNVLPQIFVIVVNDVVFVILAIVTLSYLGLGIQPPTPNWGAMIADGQAFLTTKPLLVLFPGVAVLLTGLGFSLLADGIADRLRTSR